MTDLQFIFANLEVLQIDVGGNESAAVFRLQFQSHDSLMNIVATASKLFLSIFA